MPGLSNTSQARTLERLIDSPVLAGAHLRTIPLTYVTGVPHFLDVATEEAKVELPPELIAGLSQVANEAAALFGGRGYRSFHFLLGLSDQIPNFDSNTTNVINTASPNACAATLTVVGDVSARPRVRIPGTASIGVRRTCFPQICIDNLKTDLLWVYEGLTQYLGLVLDARSGTMDQTAISR